jgi:hypothetical protein
LGFYRHSISTISFALRRFGRWWARRHLFKFYSMFTVLFSFGLFDALLWLIRTLLSIFSVPSSLLLNLFILFFKPQIEEVLGISEKGQATSAIISVGGELIQ